MHSDKKKSTILAVEVFFTVQQSTHRFFMSVSYGYEILKFVTNASVNHPNF